MQYAGASLSQHVFDGLERTARAELGERVMIITGYGSTETAPFAFTTTWPVEQAGHIGLPAPGMEVKLVPNEGQAGTAAQRPERHARLLARPGQDRAGVRRRGLLQDRRCGAARPIRDDLAKGFIFDGRVSEDFKLSTGTWVNFAGVRAATIAACAPLIRDVVLTGLDRNFIGALIFPDLEACARFAGLPPGTEAAAAIAPSCRAGAFRQQPGGVGASVPRAAPTMWRAPS